MKRVEEIDAAIKAVAISGESYYLKFGRGELSELIAIRDMYKEAAQSNENNSEN